MNTDRSIAFGGGLHVGEYDVLHEELGEKWMQRTVNEPMLGVEFVAKRVPGQIEYYRRMQASIWAMIEEVPVGSCIPWCAMLTDVFRSQGVQ